MGIVNFGVPLDDASYLAETMDLKVAVEGGTYRGDTTKLLSKLFARVYTIEKSEHMYAEAEKKLAGISNIQMLKGDTRTNLPIILDSEDGILFWLDAHWSGGKTYGEQDECPLIEELELIFKADLDNYAILIDDARLFMAPPPSPHDESLWPSIADISLILPDGWDMTIWNDVIFVTPQLIRFREYMQLRTTSDWNRLRKGILKNYLRGLIRFYS